ncbi:hypothetical protein ACP70R_017241 [Stipagrostis hirtigluma subsp. patula]
MAQVRFSFDEWKAHREAVITKERKKKVTITVESGGFPLGNAMTKEILDKPEYKEWSTKRFKWATMENEVKWYNTEYHEGSEEYEVADRMLALTQRHSISARGQNVFWDDQSHRMDWASKLSLPKLKDALQKRLKSVVPVPLRRTSSARTPPMAKLDDKPVLLFMNEYNTIEQPNDPAPLPTKYLTKLKQIQSYDANKNLKYGIGLESHFDKPNIPYMRGSLDTLAAAKVPIWLTEVDVTKGSKQTDDKGVFEAELFHGEYNVTVKHKSLKQPVV